MRQLTFKGFLHKYVRELSYCRSNDIRLLAREVPEKNYRLVEPLVLYALSIGKNDYLNRIAEDSFLLAESFRFEDMSLDDVISMLEHEIVNNDGVVPLNYVKVYQSYHYFRDKQINQNHTKMLMRDKINELFKQKNISVYRVYTDLGLNHGCVHDYVKNGNVQGLSLDSAKKILEYLKIA
ncbi:MAG: hypothetical protein FWD05_10725 [Oscillospiraceae bacterium]|nr:hypothetical protein [Oscillospiraceae bacterium]